MLNESYTNIACLICLSLVHSVYNKGKNMRLTMIGIIIFFWSLVLFLNCNIKKLLLTQKYTIIESSHIAGTFRLLQKGWQHFSATP